MNRAATATGVTAVVNPSVTGQTITATAGFTIASPGSDSPVAPTGTVEFEISLDGGATFNPISGCLAAGGHLGLDDPRRLSAPARFPSPPAVSSVELEAIYSGDANFATSTSPAFHPGRQRGEHLHDHQCRHQPLGQWRDRQLHRDGRCHPAWYRQHAADRHGRLRVTPATAATPGTTSPAARPRHLVWNSTSHTGTASCATRLRRDLLRGRGPEPSTRVTATSTDRPLSPLSPRR